MIVSEQIGATDDKQVFNVTVKASVIASVSEIVEKRKCSRVGGQEPFLRTPKTTVIAAGFAGR